MTDGRYNRVHDWMQLIETVDPALAGRIADLVAHVVRRESTIPRHYKELILMCCNATLRNGASLRSHGVQAMKQGASREAIVEALALASLVGGFPVMIEAMDALGDRLDGEHQGACD